jgi:anti-anti-sigma factor
MNEMATVSASTRGETTTILVQGEIDMANAADVHSDVLTACGDGPWVVIDLGGVTYLDSAGIRVVSELQRRFHEQGRTLVFAIPEQATCRRVLELTLPDLPIIGTHQ